MKQGLKSINRMTIDSNLSHVICRPVKPAQLATADTPRFLSHAHYRRPPRSCCWLVVGKARLTGTPGLVVFNGIKYGVSSDIGIAGKEKWRGLCLSGSFLVISAASGKNKANKTFINAGFFWFWPPSSHFFLQAEYKLMSDSVSINVNSCSIGFCDGAWITTAESCRNPSIYRPNES